MSEPVPVVTAFVHSGNRVALIKRSQEVGTYRGAWAAFSGYVEQMPLDQAYTELSEEAGLSRDNVMLRGIGVPLPVEDAAHSWLVLPFLFELREAVDIQTDWEAEEWRWIYPIDVEGMETVPGLEAALDRVWPPFGDGQFWSELSQVAGDKVNGATELARRGLRALGGYVQDRSEAIDNETLVRSVRAFAACRPTMGVFPDLAARLLLAIGREGGQFDFDEFVTEMLAMIDDATALSVDSTSQALTGTSRILTLSCSEVVRRTILQWRHEESEVCIAESHPGGEGVTLADQLHEEGMRTRIIPDRDIPTVAGSVDAVLVGCDAITEADTVVNKVGTQAAVTSAKEAGVPAFAVAQTFKIVPPGWPFLIELWAGAGVSGHSHHVSMGTVVFDETPLGDFTAVLTEEGRLTSARLSELRTELSSVELLP